MTHFIPRQVASSFSVTESTTPTDILAFLNNTLGSPTYGLRFVTDSAGVRYMWFSSDGPEQFIRTPLPSSGEVWFGVDRDSEDPYAVLYWTSKPAGAYPLPSE